MNTSNPEKPENQTLALGSLVSVREASKRLSLPYAPIKRLVKQGVIPALKLGSRVLVSVDAVRDALVSHAGRSFAPQNPKASA